MANNEFAGSALYAHWIHPGGTVVLSAENRNFTYSENIETIDATAGSDATRRKIASFKNATAALSMTAQSDGTALLTALAAGVVGTLIFGEAGSVAGKPKTTMPALSLGINRSVPYADIVTYDISWDSNADPTYGVW
ncbi:MAG: hypothetical protein WC657_08955 [Candidatus Paceibacterota bacterium]|jgi:hypothetical protein